MSDPKRYQVTVATTAFSSATVYGDTLEEVHQALRAVGYQGALVQVFEPGGFILAGWASGFSWAVKAGRAKV